jgi:hypothetical protein
MYTLVDMISKEEKEFRTKEELKDHLNEIIDNSLNFDKNTIFSEFHFRIFEE